MAQRINAEVGHFEIWSKPLDDGSMAVGIFNLSETELVLTVSAEQLGIRGVVRDLWRQQDVGIVADTFSAKVDPHGVVLIKVTPPVSSIR